MLVEVMDRVTELRWSFHRCWRSLCCCSNESEYLSCKTMIARMGGHATWMFSAQQYLHKIVAFYSPATFLSPSTIHASALESSSTSTSEGSRKWRFSVLFLLLPCAATFGLGTWQLLRRQWKVDLLDCRRKMLEEDPIPLVDVVAEIEEKQATLDSIGPTTEALEFRRVFCEGVYEGHKSFFVGPRARSAFGLTIKGYYLITPLSMKDGDSSLQVPVLVNRGWVPSSWREEFIPSEEMSFFPSPDDETRYHGDKKGGRGSWWKIWSKRQDPRDAIKDTISPKKAVTVKVSGVIRGSEQPHMFVPSNIPDAGQWFYIDVPAMARAAGLPENTILVEALHPKLKNEDLSRSEVYPITKDPETLLQTSVMPAHHLNYALSWYSLSAATAFMTMKLVQGAGRGFY